MSFQLTYSKFITVWKLTNLSNLQINLRNGIKNNVLISSNSYGFYDTRNWHSLSDDNIIVYPKSESDIRFVVP